MAAADGQPALAALQQALGHAFSDTGLLELALTHSSTRGPNQQRLEFLGDAVLGAAVSAQLYRTHPEWDEGEMSVARTRLVCQDSLARAAVALGVPDLLRVSPAVARSGAVHQRASVLADTVEALLGAVFLDGGFAASCAAVERLLADRLDRVDPLPAKDAKTRLQEWLQARGWPIPVYRLVTSEGPANALVFRAECRAGRPPQAALGEARSRKAAEQLAAAALLALLDTAAGNPQASADPTRPGAP